jgi:hypothetical protein
MTSSSVSVAIGSLHVPRTPLLWTVKYTRPVPYGSE